MRPGGWRGRAPGGRWRGRARFLPGGRWRGRALPDRRQAALAQLLNGGDGFNTTLARFMVRIGRLLAGASEAEGREEPGEPAYHVATGAAQFLRHYAACGRKRANARIVVNPAAGANDGLLRLVADTPQKCGNAARAWACINFGALYDFDAVRVATEDADPKRMKSMIELCFKKLGAATSAAAASVASVIEVEAEDAPAEGESPGKKAPPL